jgi:hypothetical protein
MISQVTKALAFAFFLNAMCGCGIGLVIDLSHIDPPPVEDPSPYYQAVMEDTPVGYWRFDEASGTLAYDYSGNNRHGFYDGGVTQNQSTPICENGPSILLDGVNDSVFVPHHADFATPEFSVEAWLKRDGNPTTTCGGAPTSGNTGVFKRNTRLGNFEQWVLGIGTLGFFYCISEVGGAQDCVPGQLADTTQWHHVVITFEQPDMNLYVDGVASLPGTHNYPLDFGSRPLFIGKSGECGGPGEGNYDSLLMGQVDEVAVYDYVLTPARVLAHFEAASDCP